ncbi:MAG: hypothetical protein NTX57_03220 [Armatimonadetes bacterium]|nr:hypothetical protein [Armatimonadota bacterium]
MSDYHDIEEGAVEFSECPELGPSVLDTHLPKPTVNPWAVTRRDFLRRGATAGLTLGAADFLGYLLKHGDPNQGAALAASLEAKAAEGADPHYLIYWFVEGGWESYDMFSPLDTENNIFPKTRLPFEKISAERYRVLNFNTPGYRVDGIWNGKINYGYLAEPGKSLFPEMAVLSSMHTGQFHSGERLKAHMGSYDLRLQADRDPDERSVMQAFAEVYGQSYALPNLSWHWWLSDGELNEVQYTGRKGYYHALGPAHAHTIYGGTPANLRDFLLRMQGSASDVVNRQIEKFLDNAHAGLRKDTEMETIKSYNSARQIYAGLSSKGKSLDRGALSRLFTDPTLKEKFKVKPVDELITYRSINGNKARTKFCPATNVQAMMTYELMRENLSCAYFIETRDIRHFDSHHSRKNLWAGDGVTPKGQPDQTTGLKEELWEPLLTLVELLKNTPHKTTGKPIWDYTTVVLTSEFGRSIHGDVDDIIKSNLPMSEKKQKIDGQDISEHWFVTSAAFLGPKVKGGTQWGRVGTKTMQAIPLQPDGSLHPDFDPVTGEGPVGWNDKTSARYNATKEKLYRDAIPNHGDVYATALYLCDIPKRSQTGRNDRNPLAYIKRSSG